MHTAVQDSLRTAPAAPPRRAGPSVVAGRAPKARAFDYIAACLIPVYVWRIQDVVPILGKIQFPVIISLTAFVVFVFGGYAAAAFPRFKMPAIKVALFLLIWTAVSVPLSVYPGLSARFVVSDFSKTILMMLMVASSIRHVNDVERLALANMAGAVIYCVKILTTFQVGDDGRLASLVYYDANDLAMMVVCTIPFAVYFLRSDAKVWQRLIALPCAAIFMLAIARSGSRGGFLGLVAVVLFLMVGFRAIPARTRIGAVVGIGLLLILVAGPKYWALMGSILTPEQDYNTSAESGRMLVWERGIGYMAGHPITGVGANAFSVAEGTISEIAGRQLEGQGVKWSAAHNSFVQIGAELGIPGLCVFTLFLWRLFQSGWRIARGERAVRRNTPRERALSEALLATLVGYGVAGFFLSQAYSAYLYATAGILTGLAAISVGTAPVPSKRVRAWPARAAQTARR